MTLERLKKAETNLTAKEKELSHRENLVKEKEHNLQKHMSVYVSGENKAPVPLRPNKINH